MRCLVRGSFQPLLEALRGYEVIGFTSIPTPEGVVDGRKVTLLIVTTSTTHHRTSIVYRIQTRRTT